VLVATLDRIGVGILSNC